MRADGGVGGGRAGETATLEAVVSPATVRRWTFPPEAGLLLVVLFWGFNFAVVKVPLEVMPPFVVNTIRFVVSALVLGLLHARACEVRGVPFWGTFRAGWKTVVALGLLGHALYQICFILGIDRTTAGGAALLIATSPLVTAAAGHLLNIDRMGARGWAGVGVSLAGAVLVVLGRPGDVGGDLVGVALLLAGSVAWGLTTVLSRPVLDRGATPLGLAFWGVVIALPVLAALSIPEWAATPWARVDVWDWLALLYSGSLSTGIAYWLWNDAVRQVGPSRTAAFSNLVPFVGVGAGAVLLGEPIAWLQVLGGALIVAGLVVVRKRKAVRGRVPASGQ